MTIRLKRVYLPPEDSDGLRVLVDRLWPRGLRKADAAIELWARELAPSDALRAWFARDPAKWVEFGRRYFAELDGKADEVRVFKAQLGKGRVTFVFAKADETRNNAVALKDYLERAGKARSPAAAKRRATARRGGGASPARRPRRARRRARRGGAESAP